MNELWIAMLAVFLVFGALPAYLAALGLMIWGTVMIWDAVRWRIWTGPLLVLILVLIVVLWALAPFGISYLMIGSHAT